MPDLSSITLPNNVTYYIKDAEARKWIPETAELTLYYNTSTGDITMPSEMATLLNTNHAKYATHDDILHLTIVRSNNHDWSVASAILKWTGGFGINALDSETYSFGTPFMQLPGTLGYGWIELYCSGVEGWKVRVKTLPVYNGGVS